MIDISFADFKEQLPAAVVVLIALAYATRSIVEALKGRWRQLDGHAGQINQVVSFVIALGGFALTQLGQDAQIIQAEQLGEQLAVVLTSTVVLSIVTFLVHKVINVIEGGVRIAQPFRRGPVG